MNKLPECDRCQLYAHNPHLICAIHPEGVTGDACLDFAPDPNLPAPEQWEPVGASYYMGELILDSPVERLTKQQQLALLDSHPMFTGKCPGCGTAIEQTDPPRIYWDCHHCNWIDDAR